MRNAILIGCFLLSFFTPAYGNEWPVYYPAPFTSPVPDPANSGTGVLERYTIAPNEKIIKESDPDEEWTVEFDSPNRIILSSSIDGPQGTFSNGQKCRSNNKRLVLTPMGPNYVIIENAPADGDKFYFTVTGAASKNENFMTLFGDYNQNPYVEFWHGAIDVRVSGTPYIAAPASIYPVRSGMVSHVDEGLHEVAVEVSGTTGVYDIYSHVEDIEVIKGETVVASGPNATRIASHVIHGVIPHLHFEVSDWYETNPTPPNPTPKAIRNPLNGIVPFNDSSQPETKEIRFRSDDYETPTPIFNKSAEPEEQDEDRSGLFDFISGKMDVIARVSDDNDINDIGPPEESCGIHQIQYKIYDGFDLSGVILQEGILFNDTTFRGEHPMIDDEYTPYYFDIYGGGCHSVP